MMKVIGIMGKPRVSILVHTASVDRFLHRQGIPSYFRALLHHLAQQTMTDLELVYVDAYWPVNRDVFQEYMRGCTVRCQHVPVHHEHRYWHDLGYTYISSAKNTAILYAEGELLITCDDAEFFPDDFVETCWNAHQQQRYITALHRRLRTIQTLDGLVVHPVRGSEYSNDHRWQYAVDGTLDHQHGSWGFAGTCFTLEDALLLNGFNERMDGCKSLEDCDFATRLTMLGRTLQLDPRAYLYIVDHPSYLQDGHSIAQMVAVENYGVLRCSLELGELRANSTALTDRHWDIIRRETVRYRGFDPLNDANRDQLRIWSAVPTFDLRKQRERLRDGHGSY